MKIVVCIVTLLGAILVVPARATVVTPIQVPGSANWTTAFGVNDLSQVVGAYQTADGKTRGYVYNGSSFETFNVPGDGGYTVPYSINNAGAIAGIFGQSQLGFIYEGGVFRTVQPPGIPQVNMLTINNHGDVAGWWDTAGVVKGFIQTASGNLTTLDPSPFIRMYVAGLNDNGEISGRFDQMDPDGVQPGFLGQSNSLQLLSYPSARLTSVGGNNNFGDGAGFYGQNGPWYAFTYINGTFAELPVQDSANVTASDINNSRIVVGTYTTLSGVTKGFITQPISAVPEPSTLHLFLLAPALAVAQARLRRRGG